MARPEPTVGKKKVEKEVVNPSQAIPPAPKTVSLNDIAEKQDACLDASKEMVKALGDLVTELRLKKKAGNF